MKPSPYSELTRVPGHARILSMSAVLSDEMMSRLKLACGNRLRRARIALGMTTRQLASATNVGETRITNWERGRHFPAPEFLVIFHRKFGVTADWILLGSMAGMPRDLAHSIEEIDANW